MPSMRKRLRARQSRSNVEKANRASSSDLRSSLDQNLLSEAPSDLSLDIVLASDLSERLRNEIWTIWETNMKELYTHSSFGWNPNEKQAELFHRLSRFILARKPPEATNQSEDAPSIVAFSMFRFEREEAQDVVYCYELQVTRGARRMGLGGCLMRHLVSIANGWNMQKIMLTVFKSNITARKFYKAIGFVLDPTSPECHGVEEVTEDYDYEILCMLTPSR